MSLTHARTAGMVRLEAVGGAPDVWLVGPWHLPEFAALRLQLDAAAKWPAVDDIEATTRAIDAAASAPEVILLAEPRPGVHRQAAVDALMATAPLSRVIVVAGSWCEGELRSGRPLQGVLRIYAHQLPPWWRTEILARTAGAAPHWSAPTGTTSLSTRKSVGRQLAFKNVAIVTKDFAAFETLASALRASGAACRWESHDGPDVRPPDLGVWDGGQLDPGEQFHIAHFCQRFSDTPAPVLVLLDYPRLEHCEAILRCGASALLGKPYSLDALIDALLRLAEPRENLA